jgi:hypothetical protein
MIWDILLASLQAGLPVAVASFFMVYWALKQGYIDREDNSKSLHTGLRKMRKSSKKDEKKISYNPVHDKWLSLGGGFYGIVGLLTYVVIEWRDVSAIILDLGGFMEFIRQFDIGVIVSIFVESLVNFITAVTWPLYWLGSIDSAYPWLWFLAAYAGYWLGLKRAQQLVEEQSACESDTDSGDPD